MKKSLVECVWLFLVKAFKGFNIAHLVTSGGLDVEMFEMKERQECHKVDFSRIGLFLFYLQTEDFEGVIERTSAIHIYR